MAFHLFLFLLVVCLLPLVLLWRLCRLHLPPSPSQAGSRRTPLHRLLKPRTALDCPICRLTLSGMRPAPAPVRPWCEAKSRRGAPKRIHTDGFACPNQQCAYFGITDAHIHAAFWRWQAWPCRADPDLSRPCVPHDVQCPAQHPLVPVENPFPAGRHRAVCTGRRTGCFRGRTGLWLPSGDDHHLALPRWSARSKPSRSLVLSSPASLCPVGRTAY